MLSATCTVAKAVPRWAAVQSLQCAQHCAYSTGLPLVDSTDEALGGARYNKAGRSSVSGIVATVFGSTGFMGRYVVNNLGKIGSQVILPYRGEESGWKHLKVMGDLGQIAAIPFSIREPESIVHAIQGSNVVINLLGRDKETRNFSFNDVHVKAPQLIAQISQELGVKKLIHLSSLGAHERATSPWNKSKLAGEREVLKAFPGATILRCAPIFGPNDRFSTNLARRLRYWPVVPVFSGEREIQPIYAPDVADAIMGAITGKNTSGQTFELGGPVVYQQGHFYDVVADLLTLNPRFVTLPNEVNETIAKVLELSRNPILTHDEVSRSADGAEIVNEGGALTVKDLGINPEGLRSFENVGYRYLSYLQEAKNRYLV